MEKILQFADLLNALKVKRETQILHDLSNKFNLLTLAFEEIEEMASEDGPIEKKALSEEIVTFQKAKDKYVSCSNQFKEQSNLSHPQLMGLDDIFEQVKACLQKDIVKQGVTPTVENYSGCESLAFIPTFTLLSSIILLRLILKEKSHYSFELKDLESFINKEKSLCDKHKEGLSPTFKASYLDYLTGLWLGLGQVP